MADEKLPEYVAGALAAFAHGESSDIPVAAINRFAREREAAALERAADIAHHVAMERILNRPTVVAAGGHVEALDAKASEALRIENAIRALIHKEPANG